MLFLLDAGEVRCDQDFFVVPGFGGHELVDQLG
jgi:hypothetical protein